MTRAFSFYEFTGVLLPGATLLLGLAVPCPELRDLYLNKDFGTGQFGLFVVASYLLGHLVQAVGNLIEGIWWNVRGMPSTWIRRAQPPYLSAIQIEKLPQALAQATGMKIGLLAELDEGTLKKLTGQLATRLTKEGRTEKLEIFNGNYGLFRGIASALVVVLAACIGKGYILERPVVGLLLLLVLAMARMNRFGVHYASELYRQVLDLYKHSQATPV